MKRLIGCILIAALLTGFSLYGFNYVKSNADGLISMVEDIAQKYSEKLYDKAAEIADAARSAWRTLSEGTVFIDDCSYGIELSSAFSRAAVYARMKNDEIYAELGAAKGLLEAFGERQCPTFENVF